MWPVDIAQRWRWLFAPTSADLGFAVRTSAAAILSLLIAMWMELDSPAWAPLTVWVVATASRGETLSKARWRLVGTGIGCCMGVGLIAAFPQETGLFFIGLALWIGLCCGFATFFGGYRRYGFLVASFTSVIVSTGAIHQPDDVFSVAIARGTYIVLGIVCEAALAAMFLPTVRDQARQRLLMRLDQITAEVSRRVNDIHAGAGDIDAEQQLLASIIAANARIEYDVLEMGAGARRQGDHARGALACLLGALARARGGAPHEDIGKGLAEAHAHIQTISSPRRGDRFTFRTRSPRDKVEALYNALRAITGIIGAWLLWEITAWPSGTTFVAYVALVYGLLDTREIPALASSGFFRGALWCAAVAAFYVFRVVPAVTSPECLACLLAVPAIAGGLAARNPALVNHAFSFNMFLPVLIGPSNLMRYDEVSFLNTTGAFLGAVLFARLTFGVVLPFRADDHLMRTARWVDRRLGTVARDPGMSVHRWLSENADSMVRAARMCQRVPPDVMRQAMARHLQAMVLGMWVIELRDIANDPHTPAPTRKRLRVFLRTWTRAPLVAVQNAAMIAHNLQRHTQANPAAITALNGVARSTFFAPQDPLAATESEE
ncbi:FUSC family protein [Acetobacter sp. TBRC 12305]|uniref:FUSC family protein n=1 Tax=Acetobacter garciniae TaxID=2817435 RepID=A0A939HK98_9PROT|nr:FUSC family protein [Acetobacter garciniae]MBX0343989.1 FUSC family protein [Acetobacter garciniae]